MGVLDALNGKTGLIGGLFNYDGVPVGKAIMTGDALGIQGQGITENLLQDYPSHATQINRIHRKIMDNDTYTGKIGNHAGYRFDQLNANLTGLTELGLDDTQMGRVLNSLERNTGAWVDGMGSSNFVARVRRIAGEPAAAQTASQNNAAAAPAAVAPATSSPSSDTNAESSEAASTSEQAEDEAQTAESETDSPGFDAVDTSGDTGGPSNEGEAGGFAGLFGGNFDLSQIFGGFDLSNMGGGAFESLQNILPGIGSLLTGVFSDMTHHSGTALANLEADGDVSMMTRFETVLNSGVYSIGKANRVGNGSMYESSDIPVNFDGSITSTVDAETGVERVGPPPAPSQGTEPTQPQPGQQAPAAMAQNTPGQQGPQTPRPSGPDDTAFA